MSLKVAARGLLASALSVPNAVIGATAAMLVGGGAAVMWLAGSKVEWFPLFFEYPGELTVFALNIAGLVLSIVAVRQFSRGEPLRLVWSLVALAAGCNLLGGVFAQVLAQNVVLNPLRGQAGWSGEGWLRAGVVLGGPVQMSLLLAGLALALRIYRRAGIESRPRRFDWVLMGVATVFSVWEICDFLLRAPAAPGSFQRAVSVIDDPLLSVLLVVAILIRRSALNMGRGLIARCWGAFTAAILLTFVGDIAVWLAGHSPIPLSLTATTWYLWFLASGACALAPAYQLEACRRASMRSGAGAAPVPEHSAMCAAGT